jgi:hypothetical protein
MPSLRLKPYALLLILLAPATLLAELSLPHFFSNNMVLQRDPKVPTKRRRAGACTVPRMKIILNLRGAAQAPALHLVASHKCGML